MGQPNRRTFLTASAAAVAGAAVAGTAAAQPAAASGPALAWAGSAGDRPWPAGPGGRWAPQAPDRELTRLLGEVDQRRIRATVEKLASFGTRHTLSSQTDPARGIGAARDWIFAELSR
ncbi:MAG: leucine aminopeptidase-related protein, partial [Mycobacterium sp.]|nr:leucine aminopeptidase-related protein [Mycobacterium sp.]